jgi:hypothetical protein
MRRGRVQHGAIHCFPQAFAAPGDYLFFLLLQIVVELPLLNQSKANPQISWKIICVWVEIPKNDGFFQTIIFFIG